jgi:hypothetical protein
VATLDRKAILQADDLALELVNVPEWGGEVYVRAMTGTERDRFEVGMYLSRENPEERAVVRARVVAYCTVDEKGKALFTAADIDALGRKSAKALDRIFSVASRLSGTDAEAPKGAEASFGDGPSEASTSA